MQIAQKKQKRTFPGGPPLWQPVFWCLSRIRKTIFLFMAAPAAYGYSQARGWISCSCQPMPQPRNTGILATSVNYTKSHGNARSLTHWSRPGMEPASSWILVGFVTTDPWRELRGGRIFEDWLSRRLLCRNNICCSSLQLHGQRNNFPPSLFWVFLSSAIRSTCGLKSHPWNSTS